jgi:hypothetical protein
MQPACTPAAPEYREFVPFKSVPSAHDAHCRWELFEMGSVSGIPSTASTTTS